MEKIIETKNAVVTAVPADSTFVLIGAMIAGVPTVAQIETARYAVEANLENVGATSTSSYLTRFEPVALSTGDALRVRVNASLVQITPDPIHESVAAPEEAEA